MDFSLLSTLEFFFDMKNGDGRDNNRKNLPIIHCYADTRRLLIRKNYLSVYNKVVQALLQKGKVIYKSVLLLFFVEQKNILF